MFLKCQFVLPICWILSSIFAIVQIPSAGVVSTVFISIHFNHSIELPCREPSKLYWPENTLFFKIPGRKWRADNNISLGIWIINFSADSRGCPPVWMRSWVHSGSGQRKEPRSSPGGCGEEQGCTRQPGVPFSWFPLDDRSCLTNHAAAIAGRPLQQHKY